MEAIIAILGLAAIGLVSAYLAKRRPTNVSKPDSSNKESVVVVNVKQKGPSLLGMFGGIVLLGLLAYGAAIVVQDTRKYQYEEKKKRLEGPLNLGWFDQVEQSPLDDSTNVYLSLLANHSVDVWLKSVRPRLTLRCKENKTQLIISFNTPLVPHAGHSGEARIIIRIDKNKAETLWMLESLKGDAVFFPHPIEYAKHLSSARTLLVQFEPYNQSPQQATFDLTGLSEKLPMVRKECGW